MASSQSNMCDIEPSEINKDESYDSSEESDCSSCPEWDKPLECYYCKCCTNKIYYDGGSYMRDENFMLGLLQLRSESHSKK